MRLERLASNKFKVFLTYDDLKERGISKEDLWQDVPKVHDLFRDMMLEADDELGFKVDGPVAVEVYAMPAQGMVIIVTKGLPDDQYGVDYDDGYIEMQVTLDETEEIFYEFQDIEDVIDLTARLYAFGAIGGTLYSFEGRYYLSFEEYDLDEIEEEAFVALLAEYGNPATVSSFRVAEYGKVIAEHEAILQLYMSFFGKRTDQL
ncbi:genetic competence negative regulator [Alkalihalobacillus oceani]|uniref:genetic competence negative regulator n=1 Tax=Halalkalibacter oceani TaxID=1653776 RepID=UPI00203A977C|nr:genetic competence negative regulator [Halalkalibacter oceani]MCM3763020.1 genetic competence negative regulator [Halalkalibacter oceani]